MDRVIHIRLSKIVWDQIEQRQRDVLASEGFAVSPAIIVRGLIETALGVKPADRTGSKSAAERSAIAKKAVATRRAKSKGKKTRAS